MIANLEEDEKDEAGEPERVPSRDNYQHIFQNIALRTAIQHDITYVVIQN